MGTLFVLVVRRSFASRGMLAMVALGILVAATLLASAPIYARTMADLGLTFAIRDELEATPAIRVEFLNGIPIASPDGIATRAAAEKRIDERLGWFRASQSRNLKLGLFAALRPGQELDVRPPFGQPQSLSGYEAHVTVVAGALPQPGKPGEPIQVTVSSREAQAFTVKPGDTFTFREAFDTCEREIPTGDIPPPPPPCNPGSIIGFTFPAVVVGIVDPIDPDDPFWVYGVRSYFEPWRIDLADMGPILPMFVHEQAITEQFAPLHPSYLSRGGWNVFVKPEVLNRTNYQRASADIAALYAEFEPAGGFAFSTLTDTLRKFGESSNYQQKPLTILLLEITGIALFYVALVSAIVIERESAEIGLLRGRGATNRQVLVLYVIQGLILGLPALFIAPFLAAGVTALLGLTPTFNAVSNGDLLPVAIPPMAFGMAALGIVLSVAALVFPAFLVSRRGTMSVRRSASRPEVSIFQRYYLDLGLAAIALLLLFELRQKGSVFTPSPTGGLTSDPLLLASPALTIAAAGALILRFYPIVMRLVARLTARRAGAPVVLGFSQTVRNSSQYTRLALLLMMAVAVGTFAASYTTTTDRSYADRANFEAGADLRVRPGQGVFPFSAADVDKRSAQIEGVSRASTIIRTKGAIATAGPAGQDFQLLAVDPPAVADMLWFRPDFADRTLQSLLFELGSTIPTPGKALPGKPTTISVWVKGDAKLSSLTLWGKVRDADGDFILTEFGELNTQGEWRQLTAPATDKYKEKLAYPLTLVSLLISEPTNRFGPAYPPLFMDDFSVTDGNGTATSFDDFEAGFRWAPFLSRTEAQDQFATTTETAHGGTKAGRFQFKPQQTSEPRGIYIADQITPLPAVVSESFAAASGLRPGGFARLRVGEVIVPILVADTYRLFPTLSENDGPSVILNRDQLIAWMDEVSFSSSTVLGPNEIFLSLKPGADPDAVAKAFSSGAFRADRAISRQEALTRNERNPLIAAGGTGILFVAFVAILALVAAAMLASLVTSVRRRRTEFAVVRALGMSRGQIVRMLILEYGLVFSAGILAGGFMGLVVGRQMLGFLNVTERGERIEPEFILQTNWSVVTAGVALVIVAFAVALAVAIINGNRTSDTTALRTD